MWCTADPIHGHQPTHHARKPSHAGALPARFVTRSWRSGPGRGRRVALGTARSVALITIAVPLARLMGNPQSAQVESYVACDA
jgi:hypothetical protein